MAAELAVPASCSAWSCPSGWRGCRAGSGSWRYARLCRVIRLPEVQLQALQWRCSGEQDHIQFFSQCGRFCGQLKRQLPVCRGQCRWPRLPQQTAPQQLGRCQSQRQQMCLRQRVRHRQRSSWRTICLRQHQPGHGRGSEALETVAAAWLRQSVTASSARCALVWFEGLKVAEGKVPPAAVPMSQYLDPTIANRDNSKPCCRASSRRSTGWTALNAPSSATHVPAASGLALQVGMWPLA